MQPTSPKQRNVDELAFLPAALEIQESPPNPAGRMLMWVIIAMVLFTLAWAMLGQVDIVAVAPGKVIPSGRVKLIQPIAAGQVRAIHVRDGEKIKAGQVLIELDATLAKADQRGSECDGQGRCVSVHAVWKYRG